MNKTDREYFENRVKNIVRCTNGTITDVLNATKKVTKLTKSQKFTFINNNEATRVSNEYLLSETADYRDTLEKTFLRCFIYPETKTQKEQRSAAKVIDQRIEELTQEVILESKRLVDKAVLNLINKEDIPDALLKLSEMSNLAKSKQPQTKCA